MRLTDEKIKAALENGGYARRPVWPEKRFCYRVHDEVFECGYLENGIFEPCKNNEDRYGVEFEIIFAEDWEITA